MPYTAMVLGSFGVVPVVDVGSSAELWVLPRVIVAMSSREGRLMLSIVRVPGVVGRVSVLEVGFASSRASDLHLLAAVDLEGHSVSVRAVSVPLGLDYSLVMSTTNKFVGPGLAMT